MKSKEVTAIEQEAKRMNADAALYVLDKKRGECGAIQYAVESDNEITARFFSAFAVKDNVTRRAVFSRLKRNGLPALGTVSVRVDDNVAIVCYERRLDASYGYRNRERVLENFLTENLFVVQSIAEREINLPKKKKKKKEGNAIG